jgi:hypothetical protein
MERLASLTAAYNAIGTNAKKIDELPIQTNLDPASKIHVSRGGISESIAVQELVNAVNAKKYSQLVSGGGTTFVGLKLFTEITSWIYDGVNYATTAVTETDETLCDAGMLRKDILVANQLNQIILMKGEESATIRIAPKTPIGNVFILEFDVDDAVIGNPSEVVFGNKSILEREKQPFQVYNTGEINDTYLDDFFYGYLNFRGAVTNLKSCKVYQNTFLYSGKEILVKNSQATDITIFHLNGLGFQFSFPNAENLVLHPNEIIRFSMKIVDPSSGVLEYVGRINAVASVAVADVVGLPAALAAKVTQTEIDALGTQLLGGAPADANTLKELNDKIIAVQAIIGGSTADGDSLVNTVAELLAVFSTYSEGVDLVSLLAGKVDKTDIYNALDCIVAGKVADARQVKVLNDLIVALTGVVGNKVDKVAGKSLLSDTEIARLLTLENSTNITVVKIGTNTTLDNTYNGKVILLTASCTLTLPNGLALGFNYSVKTRAGVTLTYALGGSIVLLDNTGTTMAEKLSHTIANTGVANEYLCVGNL